MSFSMRAPDDASAISAEELERRVVISPDQCVIDNRHFYLRGRSVIPIHEREEFFVWGVWVEASPKDFLRAHELWRMPGRELAPKHLGWLNAQLPIYGNTLNLQVSVHTRAVGQRPRFLVSDTGRRLAVEQREGISLARAQANTERMLHPSLFPGTTTKDRS